MINILSFRAESIFSFAADKSSDLESYHVVEVAPDVRLLKFGVIHAGQCEDSSKREYVLKYLKVADFNISNIGYDDKDNVTFQHKTKDADGNDRTYDLPVEVESRGTIRKLDIAK